jgi:nucleotide-binding universal stress UspA family protein
MADTEIPQARSPLLVFGDDGSPSADLAWSWIIDQRWDGWSLEVLTVVPAPLPDRPDEAGDDALERALDHRRSPVPEVGFFDAVHLVVQGDPREVLTERDAADLVVIGPRGKSPLERLLVGSTANALLSSPPAPLVIVRSQGPVRRVIACTDGSTHAAAAVRALASLPLVTRAEVIVLGVHDDGSPVEDGIREAKAILAEVGVDARTALEEGMVPGIVLREIDEAGADLVVLGTRGHTGLRRLWVGSTASAVAQSAPCSVLVAMEAG